jgi:hypothetical protein
MKLKYFFFCILAAASLTASPEIALAHGGGGGHGFGGFTGRGFRPGLSGTRGYSSGRDDHGRFGDRGFRGRDRDLRGRRFRDFDGDFFDFGFYGFGYPDYYQYNYPYYYPYPY